MTNQPRCETCRYYRRADPDEYVVEGLCHRYPHTDTVSSDHWCGEWRATDEALKPVERGVDRYVSGGPDA